MSKYFNYPFKYKKSENLDFGYKLNLFFNKKNEYVSLLNDIKLYPDFTNKLIVNMVVEIPKHSTAKMEMVPDGKKLIEDEKKVDKKKGFNLNKKNELLKLLKHNPIIQDFKKKPRHVLIKQETKSQKSKKLGPGYNLGSYGALCQTFEGDNVMNLKNLIGEIYIRNGEKFLIKNLNLNGDSDPIDILLINDRRKRSIGEVVKVKVIAALAMIDDIEGESGEVDWKLIGIPESSNPKKLIKSFKNENIKLDLASRIKSWFQEYKDTKNKIGGIGFGNNRKYITDKNDLIKIIEHTHNDWKNKYIKK